MNMRRRKSSETTSFYAALKQPSRPLPNRKSLSPTRISLSSWLLTLALALRSLTQIFGLSWVKMRRIRQILCEFLLCLRTYLRESFLSTPSPVDADATFHSIMTSPSPSFSWRQHLLHHPVVPRTFQAQLCFPLPTPSLIPVGSVMSHSIKILTPHLEL